MNSISRAIEIFGTQSELAKAVGLSQAAISEFQKGAKRPSAEVAIRIEQATKGLVSVESIRADIPWHVIRGKRRKADS